MKDRQPWSVRGVTREARAKAARAASQQHITIGEWVTQVLIAAADRDLGHAPGTAPQAGAGSGNLPATSSGPDRELTQALGALVQYLERTAQANEITNRLERTEHALMGRMEQMAAGLYSLMQTMETRSMPVVEVGGDTHLMLPDNTRLTEAVERVAGAEERRQDQMAAIADALTMLASRVGDPVAPCSPAAEAAGDPIPEPEDDDDAGVPVEAEKIDLGDEVDDTPAPNLPAEPTGDDGPHDDQPVKPVDVPPIAARDQPNPPAEPDETDETGDSDEPGDEPEESTESEEMLEVAADTQSPSPAASTASWIAGGREGNGEDVVAAIRARSANRGGDAAPPAVPPRRGIISRLFGRD